MTHYLVYDVFTKSAFGGNQLAVFPDAQGVPEALLQKVAAEFNFSEVTFLYPAVHKAHTARVRIFTPTSEVDFAGHPVIGTVIALSDLGYKFPMTLELGIGPVLCQRDVDGASFTVSTPLRRFAYPEPDIVAYALGVPSSAIKIDIHVPIQASLGLPFVFVELKTLEALDACSPSMDMIKKAALKHPEGGDFAIFAYVRNGETFTSRMFAPLDNIPEDPATGSASATLAVLLTEILGAPQSLHFSQGDHMGRPSHIKAVTTDNPNSVTISGMAVKTMEGQFILPQTL